MGKYEPRVKRGDYGGGGGQNDRKIWKSTPYAPFAH